MLHIYIYDISRLRVKKLDLIEWNFVALIKKLDLIEWNFVALIKKLDLTHICEFGFPSKSKIGIECDWAFSTLLFTLKKKGYNWLFYIMEARKQ